MTGKQQIATGLLAAIIVCSVAFMPANADTSAAPKAASHPHATVVAAKVSAPAAPAPRESAHELTYN
jgi:hypothetical protein